MKVVKLIKNYFRVVFDFSKIVLTGDNPYNPEEVRREARKSLAVFMLMVVGAFMLFLVVIFIKYGIP